MSRETMKTRIIVLLCVLVLITVTAGCGIGGGKSEAGSPAATAATPEQILEVTASPVSTQAPTPLPTEEPTPLPTEEPTPLPTEEPTARPTAEPTPTPKPLKEGETRVKLTKENVLKYLNINYDYGYNKVTKYRDYARDPEDMPAYEIVVDGTWYYELSAINPDDRFDNAMVLLETRHLPPGNIYLYPDYKGRIFFSKKTREGIDFIKPADFGNYVASYKIVSAKGSVITKDVR